MTNELKLKKDMTELIYLTLNLVLRNILLHSLLATMLFSLDNLSGTLVSSLILYLLIAPHKNSIDKSSSHH